MKSLCWNRNNLLNKNLLKDAWNAQSKQMKKDKQFPHVTDKSIATIIISSASLDRNIFSMGWKRLHLQPCAQKTHRKNPPLWLQVIISNTKITCYLLLDLNMFGVSLIKGGIFGWFFFCWLLGFVVVFFFLIALRNGEEANVALVCKSAVWEYSFYLSMNLESFFMLLLVTLSLAVYRVAAR